MALRSHRRGTRLAGSALFFFALLIGTVSVRLLLDSRRQLEVAEEQRDRGDRYRAIAAFENAAKAYVPLSPYHQRGLRELELMARGALMRGDKKEAAYIFEVIRRSVLATRHFWQPNGDFLSRAEKAMAALESNSVDELSGPGGALERPADPNPILAVLLLGGFMLWIVGAVLLLFTRDQGKPIRDKWAWAATLLGLSTWLLMSWLVT